MSIRKNAFPVVDRITPSHALVSVFDKSGLEELVGGLLAANPEIVFYSTGGTGKRIMEILGERASRNYLSVEEFTGAPEMEGGLVKTLHPKIHAGLLGERGNPAHEDYLRSTLAAMGKGPGVYFDILVGNLYPFDAVVSAEGAGPEDARVNIDIGGPTMVMASAKNWHSVAVLSSPDQYGSFLAGIRADGGAITAASRFALAQEAFKLVGDYRSSIAAYFENLDFDLDVRPGLEFS